MNPRECIARDRGFSFVEIMISTVVLGIIGLGVSGVSGPASRALETDMARFDARARASRALETAARQLRCVALSSLETFPAGFETAQSVVAGVEMDDLCFRSYSYDADDPTSVPQLTPGAGIDPCRIYLASPAEDPANGLDDDSDGLIDGMDLMFERPGEQPLVLCRNVAAASLRLDERNLNLTVTVSVRAPSGVMITENASITVEVRND
jgi:prepilin-type N-terminal cleavage/methylation domain-containing protein